MIDKTNLIKEAILQILSNLGEDTSRPGLKETPLRVANSLNDLTCGYGISPRDIVKDALFPCYSKSMVIEKNIEFYSLCEHHLLPFMGVVHIAYLPNKRIVGLSKLPRIVDIFSKRLQVQENLSYEIAKNLEEILEPHGVAVVVEAQHLCMMMRGIKKQKSTTTTMEFRGLFETDMNIRSNFLFALK